MDNKPSDWHELVWRRPLTDEERAALGEVKDLEIEARLTESLAKIPNQPVATNFTSRIMSAIDQEEARRAAHWYLRLKWRVLLPRVIATAAVLVFTGTFWEHYELQVQRNLLAKNVAQVASAQPIPSLDALRNFDVIQRMGQPVAPDKELLALMQ